MSENQEKTDNKRKVSLDSMVQRIHNNTREEVRSYFNGMGINNDSIDRFKLGSDIFDGYKRFTIPVYDKQSKIAYIRLLRSPEYDSSDTIAETIGIDDTPIPKYAFYPENAKPILVGIDQLAKSNSSDVLICRDELSRIILLQEGIKMPVVTGGGIIQTFKKDWINALKDMRNIYLCMGEDSIGKNGVSTLAKRLAEQIPAASIFVISLPHNEGEDVGLAEYFTDLKGTADELVSKYAEFYCGADPINPNSFEELTVKDIASVLDSTIKYDYLSKTITFLAMILAYTESDQLNIMFNADSSTGKTYICTEVSKLFPPQDVRIFAKTTPTAFYYSKELGRIDEKTGQPYVDLERLILIFSEQPDTRLQENLRSVLSHDSKRTPFALTNKNKNGRNSADEGYILGFPSAFFCSANMRIDEQEQTRCLLLSPESTREKLLASIDNSIARNSNKEAYDSKLEKDEARKKLMERILYIKSLKVGNIDIGDSKYLKSVFMKGRQNLAPKTQREILHFMSLAKAMALVNAPFRMNNGKIIATNKDVDETAKLWRPLSISMSYGISPQIFDFYKNYILPAYYAKQKKSALPITGVTYDEITAEIFNQTGSYPNTENIRKQYVRALKTAGLISCNKDQDDKRQNIVTPLVFLNNDLEKKV